MAQTFYLFLVIGIIFGGLGAVMAYLITYLEWVHHYQTTKIPRRMALKTAMFTFAFFMAVVFVVWLFIR